MTNIVAIGGVIFAVIGAYFGIQGTLTQQNVTLAQHTEQIKTAATKQEAIESKVNDIDKNVALIQQSQNITHDALKAIAERLTPGSPVKK